MDIQIPVRKRWSKFSLDKYVLMNFHSPAIFANINAMAIQGFHRIDSGTEKLTFHADSTELEFTPSLS